MCERAYFSVLAFVCLFVGVRECLNERSSVTIV